MCQIFVWYLWFWLILVLSQNYKIKPLALYLQLYIHKWQLCKISLKSVWKISFQNLIKKIFKKFYFLRSSICECNYNLFLCLIVECKKTLLYFFPSNALICQKVKSKKSFEFYVFYIHSNLASLYFFWNLYMESSLLECKNHWTTIQIV